jgi:hypothetical protein
MAISLRRGPSRRHRILAALGAGLLASALPARAALVLGLTPAPQTVAVATPVTVTLGIAGLGNGTALSAYDLDIGFNPALLSFRSLQFGDPVLDNQLDLSHTGSLQQITLGAGHLNLVEYSFDPAELLKQQQAGGFVLATLIFDTLAPGSGLLALSVNGLLDADGGSLGADSLQNGTVDIAAGAAIPAPSSLGLLGLGLPGLRFAQRRARSATRPHRA